MQQRGREKTIKTSPPGGFAASTATPRRSSFIWSPPSRTRYRYRYGRTEGAAHLILAATTQVPVVLG